MGRPIKQIIIKAEDRPELERRAKARTEASHRRQRAQIVLQRSRGLGVEAVARRLGVSVRMTSLWASRYETQGLAGLEDRPGRGRKERLAASKKQMVLERVTQPPKGRTRWSVRSMARASGVSASWVHALWQSNGLRPHLTRSFKVSRDKNFEAKFWDVVGLYLNPPEKALILCCDEKSQCQALERTQPGLPLGVEHVRTKTHDYKRHGTVTLFAALHYMTGKIQRSTAPRHTHKQWLDFLKQLDRDNPPEVTLHLVLDNYATHKHAKVRAWMERRNKQQRKAQECERVVLHFIPTSSSWLNMVERFFRDLTVDCVRDGSFTSIKELVDQMEAYMAERDLAPQRYVWRADGAKTLAKIQRAREALKKQSAGDVI